MLDSDGLPRPGARVSEEHDQGRPPAALVGDGLDLGPRLEREHPFRTALHRRLHAEGGVRSDEVRVDAESVDHPERAGDVAAIRLPWYGRQEAL